MKLKKYIVLSCSAMLALASLFSFGLGGDVNANGSSAHLAGHIKNGKSFALDTQAPLGPHYIQGMSTDEMGLMAIGGLLISSGSLVIVLSRKKNISNYSDN